MSSTKLPLAVQTHNYQYKFSLAMVTFSPLAVFLLALIKHCKVHLSQLDPLGLKKVVTFEVLYRSLQIEPTVTLFRVFQTLCKQGHWFSFSKRHASSPICIDDNHSCIKHWKSGFFLIDRRAIPDYMSWRHPDSAINDLTPPDGCFNTKDVLEKPHHDIRPTLQRLPFYYTPPAATDVVILELTLEDLVTSNPSAKIVAKAEASQNTTRPNIFADDSSAECDDDDDSCDEILLVTLICSATVIPSSENQGGGFAAPVAEGLNTRDVFEDAIHREFFLFSPGHCYASYLEGGIFRNCKFTREEWDAPHHPTLTVLTNEVFKLNDKLFASDAAFTKSKAKGNERKNKIKSLTKSLDNLHAEVARRSVDLNRATILEAERDEEILRLKAIPLEFASFFRGQFQALFSKFLTSDKFSRPKKLARLTDILALRDTYVSPPLVKESTMTPVFESLELPSNVGASYVVDDVTKLTVIGLDRVSSSPNDVVVALSVGEKGDGFVPSSIIDEEVAATPYEIYIFSFFLLSPFFFSPFSVRGGVHAEWLPPGTLSIAGQSSVGSMGLLSLPRAKIVLSCLALELAWLVDR
nr:hypothetical protein [Tanacetum cinerariifolium]